MIQVVVQNRRLRVFSIRGDNRPERLRDTGEVCDKALGDAYSPMAAFRIQVEGKRPIQLKPVRIEHRDYEWGCEATQRAPPLWMA